jgi:hypothetical protein
LAWFDALELFLLKLDDERWNEYEMQQNLARLSRGERTGYANVDAYAEEARRAREQ